MELFLLRYRSWDYTVDLGIFTSVAQAVQEYQEAVDEKNGYIYEKHNEESHLEIVRFSLGRLADEGTYTCAALRERRIRGESSCFDCTYPDNAEPTGDEPIRCPEPCPYRRWVVEAVWDDWTFYPSENKT